MLGVVMAAGMLAATVQAGPLGPPSGFPAGLEVTDVTVGTGPAVGRGDIVAVAYAGYLLDPSAPSGHGRKFDSSADHGGEPLVFRLGKGTVIAGWDAGITGMQRGGQRHLVIPAALAYGTRGIPRRIPPNAALVFEVTLVSLQVMD